MLAMDKLSLSERDICTKFIMPALVKAGWDMLMHVSEEAFFTKGRIIVRGRRVSRGKAKKADVVLCSPEQHRIVKKVDDLMALCDHTQASLTATETTRAKLLEALLAEALAPAKEPELEAAQ